MKFNQKQIEKSNSGIIKFPSSSNLNTRNKSKARLNSDEESKTWKKTEGAKVRSKLATPVNKSVTRERTPLKNGEILEQNYLNKLKEKRKGNRSSQIERKESPLIKEKPKKVESKIRNAIANDKKIYNQMKQNKTNSNPSNSNEIEDNHNNHSHIKSDLHAEGIVNIQNYTSKVTSEDKLTTLEDKLNGLTQKLTKIEGLSGNYTR